jgi:peptidoglycan/xylan/chitin deacetylase (PgdA/CDA1 family)
MHRVALLIGVFAALPCPASARRHASDEGRIRADAMAPVPPLEAIPPLVVFHGRRDQKLVALTFDACSTREAAEYDGRIAQTLVATGTPATVFLGGRWTLEREAEARALAALPGIELGNHTFTHPHMTQLTPEEMRLELRATQAAILRVTGRQPLLFRPPFGEYDRRVVATAAELGLTTVQFDVASGDPDRHIAPTRLTEWVTQSTKSGSIVVMHINHPAFRTADALPDVIRQLRARGYSFVTVSELLRRSRGDHVLLGDLGERP